MKKTLGATILLVMPALVGAHDGPHTGPTDATFKVGKDGRVKVSENLVVGRRTVPRGTYLFEHRVEGDQHLIILTLTGKAAEAGPPLELPMRFLPATAAARRTALLAHEVGRTLELTTVEVEGEAGEHVLPAGG